MRRCHIVISLASLLSIAVAGPVPASPAVPVRSDGSARTVTTSLQIPISDIVFATGTDEWVEISGFLHVVARVKPTDACELAGACVSVSLHMNAHEVTGVGLTTGSRYVVVGATRVSQQLAPVSNEIQILINQIELGIREADEQQQGAREDDRTQAILASLQATLNTYYQLQSAILCFDSCH